MRILTIPVVLLLAANVSAEPVSVRTMPIGELLSAPAYSAPATVRARNAPRIAAETDARITSLPVQVGDQVQKGETLARLDCRTYVSRLAVAQRELETSRAQQRFAREQLARARNLQKNKSISEELLDQRLLELEVRQAENAALKEAIQQAEITVGQCEIKAPFDAVVTERLISVGDFATRGEAVVGLLENTGQEVSVALREDAIASLQLADELAFEGDGRSYPVRLRALLPSVDPVTRTRDARLVFSGPPALPGSGGRLNWRGKAQLLAADYLVRRGGSLGVFVLSEGQARFIAISAAQEGQPAAVDLPHDTALITDGRQRLRDGMAVTVTPPPD